jgi:hypothetical protein
MSTVVAVCDSPQLLLAKQPLPHPLVDLRLPAALLPQLARCAHCVSNCLRHVAH